MSSNLLSWFAFLPGPLQVLLGVFLLGVFFPWFLARGWVVFVALTVSLLFAIAVLLSEFVLLVIGYLGFTSIASNGGAPSWVYFVERLLRRFLSSLAWAKEFAVQMVRAKSSLAWRPSRLWLLVVSVAFISLSLSSGGDLAEKLSRLAEYPRSIFQTPVQWCEKYRSATVGLDEYEKAAINEEADRVFYQARPDANRPLGSDGPAELREEWCRTAAGLIR